MDDHEVVGVEALLPQGPVDVAVGAFTLGGRRDRANRREEAGDADRRDAGEPACPIDRLVGEDARVPGSEHADDAIPLDGVSGPRSGGPDRLGCSFAERLEMLADDVEVGLHPISGPGRDSGRAPPPAAADRLGG